MTPRIFLGSITVMLLVSIPVPPQVAAQHSQYRVIDIGTFGGPGSGFNDGGNGSNIVNILNNRGTLAGAAERALAEPFPGFSLTGGNNLVHALEWQNGTRTDLGALAEKADSLANWVSPNGLIAGVSETGDTDPTFPGFPELRAVLWRKGHITNLGVLPEGGHETYAQSVNSRGQVVGAAINAVPDRFSMGAPGFSGPGFFPGQTRAFLWENGAMMDLGTLGGTDAMAQFINEESQVVGWSYTSDAANTTCPFFLPKATGSYIWDKEHGMRDLGSLAGDCTTATGLNNSGTVVGDYSNEDQSVHPFIWKNGVMHDLPGTLGGNFVSAQGINQGDDTIGVATLPGDNFFHGVIWRRLGDLTDLGVVGSDMCSLPTSINSTGQVVGVSFPDCLGEAPNNRAFLWENGSMTDLNSLVPPGTSLHLVGGSDINDRGEIAAIALEANGDLHAVLLVPRGDAAEEYVNQTDTMGAIQVGSDGGLPSSAIAVPNPRLRSLRSRLPASRTVLAPAVSLSATSLSFAVQAVGTVSGLKS